MQKWNGQRNTLRQWIFDNRVAVAKLLAKAHAAHNKES